MGNKYPKIKLDLQPWEQQKLQKLKRLKKFTSLPETFHYLLHSETVFGNSKDFREALKKCFAESNDAISSILLNDASESKEQVLLSVQIGLSTKTKSGNTGRTTYDIFPSDRILVNKIKKEAKALFGKSVSDTDVFKVLLLRLNIADELSDEECIEFLEKFKQKLNDMSSSCLVFKDMYFIDDVIEKNCEDLGEQFKNAMGYSEQLSAIDLYIDMAVEQIDYAVEMITKK